jgi:Na+/melibiose symporter-like transporter
MDKTRELRTRVKIELERTYGPAATPTPTLQRLNPVARLLRIAGSPVLLVGLAIVAAILGYGRVAFGYLIAVSLLGGGVSVLRRLGVLGETFGPRRPWFTIALGIGLTLALAVVVLYPAYAPVAGAIALLIFWRWVHPLVMTLQHSLHPDLDDPARL